MHIPFIGTARAALPAATRRRFLGGSTWSLLIPGTLGFSTGLRNDLLGAVIGPRDARADPVGARAPRHPSFPDVSDADRREWTAFRRRFIAADGRVVDTGNNCVSHTEGQGYGMLFAVTFDDRPTFDRILHWTDATLSRGEDHLYRWRFDPSQADPVADPNNATDGDLFIAWALWRAAFRWNEPAYADRARAIATDILTLLVVESGGRTLLLPGATGFETADAYDVNLSYYCFPALRDLAEAVPSPRWARLRADGLALIEQGRFGRWMLPPDWLSVSRRDGSLAPAPGWPARFSYDAIRIPLYLHWSNEASVARAGFDSFWVQTAPATPAWVDVTTGATAPYKCPPGMVAIARIAGSVTNLPPIEPIASIGPSPDYYSSALILLSRLAAYRIETVAST